MSMKQDNLNFDTGLVELTINGGRTIRVHTTDAGFAEDIYALACKLSKIEEEKAAEIAAVAEDNSVSKFDLNRAMDKEMRAEIDTMFGEGFCADVFGSIRLSALADGFALYENFLFALLDKMDAHIVEHIAARNERVKKYTNKYQKKYHR